MYGIPSMKLDKKVSKKGFHSIESHSAIMRRAESLVHTLSDGVSYQSEIWLVY